MEVPLRWYPPEYFRESIYGLAGDVWAFGIVLWEMEMLGIAPRAGPHLGFMWGVHVCAHTCRV